MRLLAFNTALKCGFLFSLLFITCSAGINDCSLAIGKMVDKDCIKIIEKDFLILDSSINIEPGFRFIYQGIIYEAVEKRKHYSFISTNDPNFKTPEGIRPSDTFEKLKANPLNVNLKRGWAKTYKLPSGWICAFSFDSKITNKTRIDFLFKD
ncbi:hypothetical protein JAO77_19635 [Hymenobacter sp. BT559]|nr:hypothetical protein [Hymenobacter sp. BT559]